MKKYVVGIFAAVLLIALVGFDWVGKRYPYATAYYEWRNTSTATNLCRRLIEDKAKYKVEYILGPNRLFDRVDLDKNGVLIYRGSGIRLQNGFGAFQRFTYSCYFMPRTGDIDISMYPYE